MAILFILLASFSSSNQNTMFLSTVSTLTGVLSSAKVFTIFFISSIRKSCPYCLLRSGLMWSMPCLSPAICSVSILMPRSFSPFFITSLPSFPSAKAILNSFLPKARLLRRPSFFAKHKYPFRARSFLMSVLNFSLQELK